MKLNPSESKTVHIDPINPYAGDIRISVAKNEKYAFRANEGKTWKDMFWPSTAGGFWNPLLYFYSKRVKEAKCFELIGTINQDEDNHFRIGMEADNLIMEAAGELFFFANDTAANDFKYYRNNKGYMTVTVTRMS